MTEDMLLPPDLRSGVAEACRRYRVRRLDLFGSALTERFDPGRSDLDFLVTFEEGPPGGFRGRWFGLHDALEALLARKVDLIDAATIENPYFRRRVMETSRQIFPSP